MTDTDFQDYPGSNPERVLQELLAGNRRYAMGAGAHPRQTQHRRDEVLSAQYPSAAVLSCSDSRVPPEIIFDCGLGDIFVTRSAGHVLDDGILASLHFAVESLNVNLVLVLGHSNCGAVAAAMEGIQASGPLGKLLGFIQPAVAAAKDRAGDPHYGTTIENIHIALSRLKCAKWKKKPMIRGAFYDLKSGLVIPDPKH